jgi:NAD(P)-dependent dehydrogenase (short-subunit alcohol dehydrogenase family)
MSRIVSLLKLPRSGEVSTVDFYLTGKVILVTGGASGIGLSVSQSAGRQGMLVAVLDISRAAVDYACDDLRASGVICVGVVADVSDTNEVSAAVEAVERDLGAIDHLVACAGISQNSTVVDMTDEEWDRIIAVNQRGVFVVSREVGRRMVKRGSGSVVVIGSTDSFGGHVRHSAYAASKHAVAGFAKSAAIEWGPSNVRINVVAPGGVDTPLVRSVFPDDAMIEQKLLYNVPLRRLSQPSEQSSAVLFLLSDAASYITGAVLGVDGGLTTGYFYNHENA